MIKNNNKGFTLIELLVVVLIIGILAAMAMPQYFKAMERSRMTEAVTLLANTAQSQQRKYMQTNTFATLFSGLDVAPRGANAGLFCTKGVTPATKPASGALCGTGNGFMLALHETGLNTGYADAERTGPGTLQYSYILKRFYNREGTSCTATNANGAELCADYCGLEVASPAAGYSCCSDGTVATSGTFAAGSACATPTTGLP